MLSSFILLTPSWYQHSLSSISASSSLLPRVIPYLSLLFIPFCNYPFKCIQLPVIHRNGQIYISLPNIHPQSHHLYTSKNTFNSTSYYLKLNKSEVEPNMIPLKVIPTPGLSLVFLPISPVGNIKVNVDLTRLPCCHTQAGPSATSFPFVVSCVLSFLLPPLPILYYPLAVSLPHLNEHNITELIFFKELWVHVISTFQIGKDSKSPYFL